MKNIEHIRDFLNTFITWASDQPDVHAAALVGSYARGNARDESDIDLVILTDRPQKYLEGTERAEHFGILEKHQIENYGALTSLRVWYRDSYEVEYGITTPDWAANPLDEGTREVIDEGMSVLFEHGDLLSRHIKK